MPIERLPREMCEEHGIECIAQAVFMTENAAQMPETTPSTTTPLGS